MINIILGPPGTGKTTKLLEICRQKKEQGVPWNRIGFFSFSRKAAYEARDRARDKFQASREDLIHFRTLHSFAYKHLPIEDNNLMKSKHWKELSGLIGFNLVFDNNKDESIFANTNHKYVNLINLARLKGLSLRDAWNTAQEFMIWSKLDFIDRAITGYKKENNLYDFTDMIVDYVEDFHPTSFDVLFIDEAQDMPKIQYDMVHKLISHSNETYIAGDDDQAIFRWSGADVDQFINLKGNVQILNKSYRCPPSVYRLANYIITRIRNRRPKEWQPKDEEGHVHRMTHLRHIDLSKGKWLLLGRTRKIRNEMIEDFLFSQGYWYGRGEHRPIAPTVLSAIDTWQHLQAGETVSHGDIKTLYSKIKSGTGIKRGFKRFKEEEKDELFTLKDLQEHHGLLVDGEWYEVLDRLKPSEIAYLRRLEQLNEDIKGEPRIRVSTIHQAKGGECDNVVVLLDLGKLVYRSYLKNPDDEHRVFYVAVTRAKHNLYIIEAQKQEGYRLYEASFEDDL